jgi:hypothetical protein
MTNPPEISHQGLHNFVDLGCNDHAPYYDLDSNCIGLDELDWGELDGVTPFLYHNLGVEGHAR